MNSIEMTDVDGDALTFISRENSTWITCTSGPDEVTVGPFPTRLVRGAFAPAIDTTTEVTGTLIGRTAPARTAEPVPPTGLDEAARDRAWAVFTRLAETAPLREALDGALEAALAEEGSPSEAEVLAEDLRHVALTDPDALADHLVSLGYRKP